jgi:hypothetical protein
MALDINLCVVKLPKWEIVIARLMEQAGAGGNF